MGVTGSTPVRRAIDPFIPNQGGGTVKISGRSAAWLPHLIWDQGIKSSNLFAPTIEKLTPFGVFFMSWRFEILIQMETPNRGFACYQIYI